MTQNNLPAHLQQYNTRDIAEAALANLGSSMPPHLTIENNRFTLIDAANNEIPVPTFDPQLGPYLDACVIDVADTMSRIYYEGAYDKTAEGRRPECFSDNGIGPSVAASSPQAPTCAACPRSEWTKINANGKKVPWCTHKYKIALLIPGFQTLFLLAVPPNSHGPLREYLATCKGNGVNANNLVTRMWFVSQGTLGFMPRPGGPAMAYIDEPTAKLRQAAYSEKKTDSLVGRLDVARPANQIAVQPVQQINAPQAIYGSHSPTTQGAIQYNSDPMLQAPAQGAAPAQQFVQPVQQSAPQGGFQQPSGQQWPAQGSQQVQQPGPFGATPAGPAGNPGWPQTNAAQTAATTSPSEAAPAGRRKRRTQAEIAAANGGQQPAGPQQAPFPHPGPQPGPFGSGAQTATPGVQTGTGAAFATQQGTSAGNSQQLEFGIGPGQDANASPEVKGMLDNFFGPQT